MRDIRQVYPALGDDIPVAVDRQKGSLVIAADVQDAFLKVIPCRGKNPGKVAPKGHAEEKPDRSGGDRACFSVNFIAVKKRSLPLPQDPTCNYLRKTTTRSCFASWIK
jgi:hypothetical protein